MISFDQEYDLPSCLLIQISGWAWAGVELNAHEWRSWNKNFDFDLQFCTLRVLKINEKINVKNRKHTGWDGNCGNELTSW